jgi:arylsulfatase A-like enzyme
MVNLVDVVPTLLKLQGFDMPSSMQGEPLPTVTDARYRDLTFSEYGAGGLPFRMVDLERLPTQHGLEASEASLQWREAEGRRKMVRSREWKYITDPMGDEDELYDLMRDPWELYNVMDDPRNKRVVDELRLALLHWSIMTEDVRAIPLPDTRPTLS